MKRKQGEMMETKKRICYYDNLRFLLILLVVVGHFTDVFTAQSVVYKSIYLYIYAFHMPVFIFVSGLFFKKENIAQKVMMYISIGVILKIILFLEKLIISGHAHLSFSMISGVSWYMFVLAIYALLALVTQKINKKYLIFFSILLACFVGYDERIGDYLCLSRAIVFYPFFVLGQMIDKSFVIEMARRKRNKWIGACLLIIWGGICMLNIDKAYVLRPLFTGRNPFSVNEILLKWGGLYRFLCYVITFLTGFSILCLIPERPLPAITRMGSRTLQIYFWHWQFIMFLNEFEVVRKFGKTAEGKLIWLVLAIVLTFVLGMKVFEFPLRQIIKACKQRE